MVVTPVPVEVGTRVYFATCIFDSDGDTFEISGIENSDSFIRIGARLIFNVANGGVVAIDISKADHAGISSKILEVLFSREKRKQVKKC